MTGAVTSCYETYAVIGINIKREMVLSPNDEEVANSSKLGIPIDRVPTSKSCVFCIGMDSFFPERIISLKLMCYARRYKLGSEKSQSSDCCGFTNLLYKSLKCHEAYFFERIKQLAEEAIGNI